MIVQKDHELLNLIFERKLIEEILDFGIVNTFSKGDIIVNYEDTLKSIPIVIDGLVKVLKENKDSGESLLYYIKKGDTCSISTGCMTGYKKSTIKAICETDTKIIFFSAQKMNEWMQKYPSWRFFIINSFQDRLNELFDIIKSISFDNLEERIISYLRNRSLVIKSKIIITTHEEIAKELSTSRVVVSRILKSLESNSKLELGRNSITLSNM
ncbi:MAG: Crp/Fnr family transcriptional regulator [Flavobacteriaceae bacterium]